MTNVVFEEIEAILKNREFSNDRMDDTPKRVMEILTAAQSTERPALSIHEITGLIHKVYKLDASEANVRRAVKTCIENGEIIYAGKIVAPSISGGRVQVPTYQKN